MATKKTVKKAAKTATRTKKDDGIYWVLSERSKMFVWTPIKVFKSAYAANNERARAEGMSMYGTRGYKVTRVTLEG